MMQVRTALALAAVLALLAGCGFAAPGATPGEQPGFLMGVWHGLLAPWTLLVRLFTDIAMYAQPNTGWFYDFGFLLGVSISLPVGWIAAIIAVIVHIF